MFPSMPLITVGWVLFFAGFLVLGWRWDHAYRRAHGLPRYWGSAQLLPTRALWHLDTDPKVERARRQYLGVVALGVVYIFALGILGFLRIL